MSEATYNTEKIKEFIKLNYGKMTLKEMAETLEVRAN